MRITIEDDEGYITTYEAPEGSYEGWRGTVKPPDDEHVMRFSEPFDLPAVLFQVTKALHGIKDDGA